MSVIDVRHSVIVIDGCHSTIVAVVLLPANDRYVGIAAAQ